MTELFNGEFIVKESGSYTLAHIYYHAVSGRRVILIGTNHGGDQSYFEEINGLLEDCDLVLYESLSQELETNDFLVRDMELTFSADAEEAFLPAVRTFFAQASKFLRLKDEHEISTYPHDLPHWVCADIKFSESEAEEVNQKLFEAFAAIPRSRKEEIVAYVIEQLKKIERGCLTKRDFARGFAVIFGDPMMTRIFTAILADNRDQEVFKIFDRLVQEKNPSVVGIKFGAGHTGNQRKLLEERGYQLVASIELCNLAF